MIFAVVAATQVLSLWYFKPNAEDWFGSTQFRTRLFSSNLVRFCSDHPRNQPEMLTERREFDFVDQHEFWKLQGWFIMFYGEGFSSNMHKWLYLYLGLSRSVPCMDYRRRTECLFWHTLDYNRSV